MPSSRQAKSLSLFLIVLEFGVFHRHLAKLPRVFLYNFSRFVTSATAEHRDQKGDQRQHKDKMKRFRHVDGTEDGQLDVGTALYRNPFVDLTVSKAYENWRRIALSNVLSEGFQQPNYHRDVSYHA